jgi:hypothetical protein
LTNIHTPVVLERFFGEKLLLVKGYSKREVPIQRGMWDFTLSDEELKLRNNRGFLQMLPDFYDPSYLRTSGPQTSMIFAEASRKRDSLILVS